MQLLAAVFATLSASKSLPDLYDFSCNIQVSSQQPPSGYLSITRSASGGSARELRRQQAQGVPGACKKAGSAPTGAVCRSCITTPVSSRPSPTRRESRNGFPGSKVPGTGTLPVGVQGRSALLAPKGAKSQKRGILAMCRENGTASSSQQHGQE